MSIDYSLSFEKKDRIDDEFIFYLKGIAEAISIKEKYGELAQIQ